MDLRKWHRFTDTGSIEDKYGLTQSDLTYLVEQGELPIYVIPGDLFGRWIDQSTGQFIEGEDMTNNGPQLLLAYQAKQALRGKEISFFQRASNMPGVTNPFYPGHPRYSEEWIHHFEFTPQIFKKSQLVIMAQDLESLNAATTAQSSNDRNTLYGHGCPGEKPCKTQREMAEKLGVTEKTVYNYINKDPFFPWFSSGKKKHAYPSKLEEWKENQKK